MIWIPRILIGFPLAFVAMLSMLVFVASISDALLGTSLFSTKDEDDYPLMIVMSIMTMFVCGVFSALYVWLLW